MQKNIDPTRFSPWKNALYTSIIIFAFLVIVEVLLSVYYYQVKGNQPLAIIGAYNRLEEWYVTRKEHAERKEAQLRIEALKLPPDVFKALYEDVGTELREEFFARYEHEFAKLVAAHREIGTMLVVLYIPSGKGRSRFEQPRRFFRELAAQYGVEFVDATEVLGQHSLKKVTLLPFNGHLSRFGNQVVADVMVPLLERHSGHRMSKPFAKHPGVLGDLEPNSRTLWELAPDVPYRVVADKYGFRKTEDFDIATTKQKVLILGDSFSFGPYLANHDTYPSILNARLEDALVINAAIAGYTITSETSLFLEQARYVNPDITVLQVFDNDITGLFYFKQNFFHREHQRRLFEPTPTERAFIEKVRKRAESTGLK